LPSHAAFPPSPRLYKPHLCLSRTYIDNKTQCDKVEVR
jgi:hypothetical protein